MDFMVGLLKVVVVALIMSKAATWTHLLWGIRHKLLWQLTVGVMTFSVMAAYRWIDAGITVPFYTVVLFLTRFGWSSSAINRIPQDMRDALVSIEPGAWQDRLAKDARGALVSGAIGGIAGWLLFAELVSGQAQR